MATASVATAAGAAALLYYTLNKKPQSIVTQEHDGESQSHRVGIARVSNRLIQAPATWLETISTLSETLRFTYSETLGKWPIGDLAFGISYLLKSQGNFIVGNIFGGRDSLQLKGSQITAELRYLLKLLTLCWHFSKKPFSLFLQETGFSNENVLLQEPKAGILKPAFTILADHKTNCFLLLIRGTHSIKDTLTAATGAVVPFHHTVVHEGGVSNLVLGYAHCGMAAAARWIAKLATPCLIKGLHEHPGYTIKIVGHSLGGGTAALLTYILHEQKDLSATTCVAFAPAACMTWELAESGNDFVTSVINGADLVPTFSTASVDGLRAEVTASAWLNDLRNQVEQTRILSTVYRSASALGSHLPSIANARAKVAGAGAILRPVSNGTQVVMRSAQSMAQAAWTLPNLYLSSWSCMGPHRRVTTSHSNYKDEYQTQDPSCKSNSSKPPLTPPLKTTTTIETIEFPLPTHAEIEWSSEIECSCSSEPGLNGDLNNETVDDEDILNNSSHEDRMTEVDMWQQLDNKLCNLREDEEAAVTKELREEEAAAIAGVAKGWHRRTSVTEMKEVHRFFPPGKIMHIVSPNSEEPELGSDNATSNVTEDGQQAESKIGIFLTPRSLYSKMRLSRTMIGDHFMPVYRRQIEKVIIELEKEPFR